MSDPVTKLAYQTMQQGKSLLGLAHKEVSTRLMDLVAPQASASTVPVPPELMGELRSSMDELLECVHKLHGATRYCGVPELRAAANHLETAIKCSAPDLEHQKDQLLSAMERLQIWSDQTDWQQLFRERHEAAETT